VEQIAARATALRDLLIGERAIGEPVCGTQPGLELAIGSPLAERP